MINSDFWQQAKARVTRFQEIDINRELVFGSKGHHYQILDLLSEEELQAFEHQHQLRLPEEYRLFLQYFGAGGAGPDYGIYDFKSLETEFLHKRFELTESTEWPDDDDHPLWDFPGLLTISTSGCAIDWFLEVNGPQPGTMWVDAGPRWEFQKEACFAQWYVAWLDRIEYGLEKYVTLKDLAYSQATLEHIEKILGVDAAMFNRGGQEYYGFQGIPGRLQCQNGKAISFDVGTSWIL